MELMQMRKESPLCNVATRMNQVLGCFRIWSFEQPHGAINIVVNIRMTVIKLAGGGLWVHAPIAPTPECVRLMKELEEMW
eukprot:scaffold216360_cov46-Prasinocladus_malaysianus.AAC.1